MHRYKHEFRGWGCRERIYGRGRGRRRGDLG